MHIRGVVFEQEIFQEGCASDHRRFAGVAVATVSDVEMNIAGTIAASVGVLSTSAQQILVGHLQKKHNVTSNFLLAKASLWMAVSMLVFGPIRTLSLLGARTCSSTNGPMEV